LALVADLTPDNLAAHAKRHDELNKGKAGAIADRQVESDDLAECRARTRETLQRIKNFVKTFHGPGELSAYGFGLPLPPVRPRMQGVPNDQPPPAVPTPAAQ
jgi:hypothetical protein